MKCNLKECYWNMWSPGRGESAKVCVCEDLQEHYDENDEFELLPSNEECPSYRYYISFCGVNKGDN